MKKITTLAIATTLLSATTVLANVPTCPPVATCPPPCPAPAPVCPPPCPKPVRCFKAFQGFFLGGNVGLGTGTATQKLFVSEFNSFNVPVIGTNNRIGVRGFDGGVNAGYNQRLGDWGLGLEFVANWTNSKGSRRIADQGSSTNTTNTHSARLINSLQLRGNFSYVIKNWVAPKLIIGWDAAKWRQRTNLTGFPTCNATGTARVPFSAQKGKYLNALLVGAGVDFVATEEITIGMDATVSIYNKSSFSKTYTNTPAGLVFENGVQSVTQRGSIKPMYTKVSFNIKYNF